MSFIKDIFANRKLIATLSKNDFKTKYAGSYLGRVWAFVQPVINVVVYWFVFQLALNATGVAKEGIDAPFVIWLIAGMVPWFFFQDCVNGGTGVLREYDYLVKKVVFKIEILPVVKCISAIFVHVMLLAFTIVFACFFGIFPTLYTIQVIYYSFCVFVLSLGFVYLTSAIVVFFKDMTQIVNIFLQILIWATPIMWNIDAMITRVPAGLIMVLKANPLYYIVAGYRGALIYQNGFWEMPGLTIYFWCWVVGLFLLGTLVFKRLRPHFADVL